MHLPLHFHHHHDIAGCVDTHDDWPDWAQALLATLDRRDLQLMAAIQDQLDALVQQGATAAANISATLGVVQTKLDAATSAEPAPDLSGLSALVQHLQSASEAADALVNPVPAPVVDPAPAADVPATPAEVPVTDPAPAADGTVPAQSIPSVPLA